MTPKFAIIAPDEITKLDAKTMEPALLSDGNYAINFVIAEKLGLKTIENRNIDPTEFSDHRQAEPSESPDKPEPRVWEQPVRKSTEPQSKRRNNERA